MPKITNLRLPSEDLWTQPHAAPGTYLQAVPRGQQVAAECGWRPSSRSYACPAGCPALARRGCLHRGCLHRPFLHGSGACWYEELERLRVYDHARRWIDANGQPVVTYKPYNASDGPDTNDNATALHAWCEARVLELKIGHRSPHYPGRATLLIFRRPQAAVW